ncbi:MAG: DUF493 domain-containing protein [Lentisphaerae bacterium]|nr:DUF493 domain-containing protein [Lentisphaerota bacterium]
MMGKTQNAEIQFPCRWEFRLIVMAETVEKSRAEASGKVAGCKDLQITAGESSGGGKYCALRVACEVDSMVHAKELAAELSKVHGVRFML